MVSYDALRIRDWDHLEFAVQNLEDSAHLYTKMGFEHVASREIRDRGLRSYLMAQ